MSNITPHWTTTQRDRLRACIEAGDTIAYWCSDAFGRPINGGNITIERAAPGVVHTAPGAGLCGPGTLHATEQPHRWAGLRVWIVACRGVIGRQHDKLGCREREILGEILPEEAIETSVAIRVGAGANLAGAYLAGANLAGADLAGADLAGANLAGAYLAGADLARANLAGADLAGAYLAGAHLAGADLARANLAGADLAGADLAGADLARANLARANLAGANLARANLARANLAGAYLAGADLAGAYRPASDIPGWTADDYGYLGRS